MKSHPSKLDFQDTKTAFQHLSNYELRLKYIMFQMMGYEIAVTTLPRIATKLLSWKIPIKWIIKETLFRQFCGGETIQECEAKALELRRQGISTILDYSVEDQTGEQLYEATTSETIRNIQWGANKPWIPYCVFKPTGIMDRHLLAHMHRNDSLDKQQQKTFLEGQERFLRICRTAAEAQVCLFIDAEESWLQGPLDSMIEEAMAEHNQEFPYIYTTLQMYRNDRLEYLKTLHQKAQKQGFNIGVKLVRGAYMEKERQYAHENGLACVIHEAKDGCDLDYNEATTYILENFKDFGLCLGTHNENSTLHCIAEAEKYKIPKNSPRLWYAQLFGMSEHISRQLAKSGHRVAKYLPYGKVLDLLPYLTRRLEENSSIKGQTARELLMIQEEIRRRKQTPSKENHHHVEA